MEEENNEIRKEWMKEERKGLKEEESDKEMKKRKIDEEGTKG